MQDSTIHTTAPETPAQLAQLRKKHAQNRLEVAEGGYNHAVYMLDLRAALPEPTEVVARDRHRVALADARNNYEAAAHELKCARAQMAEFEGAQMGRDAAERIGATVRAANPFSG